MRGVLPIATAWDGVLDGRMSGVLVVNVIMIMLYIYVGPRRRAGKYELKWSET